MSQQSRIATGNAGRSRGLPAAGLRSFLSSAVDEDAVHLTVVEHLRLRARPDVFWAHIPNQGQRHPAVGRKLKGMGMIAGMPDLQLVIGGRAHFLELKRVGGKARPKQRAVMAALERAGAVVAVAAGVDAALTQLKAWEVFR